MHNIRWRLLWLALPILLLSLALWLLAGAGSALGILALILLFGLCWHLYWMEKLWLWLKKPELDTVPLGRGVWEDIFAALYQEYRRRNRAQSQLSSTLDRFQQAASALPDGVILLNDHDQIEWCNPPAETQLGLNLTQDLHQPITYLLRQIEFVEYLRHHHYQEPLKLKGLRNPDITLEIQIVPFGENQKLLVCRDISPLEKLETMRRDFIANVSHELRTPLTVVGGFLETLQDMEDGISERARPYLNMMLEQTHRMRRLVEDLLTLSQLESSQNHLQESEIDMTSLLRMVLAEAEGLSNGRHQLKLDADPTLSLTGATEELHSAFGNLVSNAIRYTPEGGQIDLAWHARGNEAVFSVTDTGPGIEPQHISRLTERFYRVDRSRSRATGGTGLGLSIVKHILTRHQATLEIESTFGQGSTFRAVFPAQRVVRKT